MKKIYIPIILAVLGLTLSPSLTYAGGGSLGMTPGSGFKLTFGNSQTSGFVPFDFRLEWRLDQAEKHAIGTDFGADFGTGGNRTAFRLNPYYHFYFQGVSGWYIGGDFECSGAD